MLLIIACITIIFIILTIILILVIKNKKTTNIVAEESINTQELEMKFNDIFDNIENEYVLTLYNIQEEKSGKYKITAKIPAVELTKNAENNNKAIEISQKINKQINDIFANTLVNIYENSNKYTILQINYATSINDNILSLVVKCILKEGTNAQRTIIKTFNYNLNNFKEINIMDIIPQEKQEELQQEIYQKIHKEIEKEKRLAEQGYNSYKRDETNKIYLLENATEFFIKDDVLYIIYSYGNSNYTSTVDLIITKI